MSLKNFARAIDKGVPLEAISEDNWLRTDVDRDNSARFVK